MARKTDTTQPALLDRLAVERLPGEFGAPWQMFSLDHDEDQAAREFQRRHGTPPEHIVEFAGALWLGPAPEEVQ